VTGIATVQQRLLILMDIARLLDNPALGLAGPRPGRRAAFRNLTAGKVPPWSARASH